MGRINLELHACQPRHQPGRTAGAVGQTCVFPAFELQSADEVHRAGQGVFFVIDSAVQVEEHRIKSSQVDRHGGGV